MSVKKRAVNPEGGGPIVQEMENVRLVNELMRRVMSRRPELPGIGVFCGPSGLGKTVASVNAATMFNAAYVECGASWNQTSLMDAVLFELTQQTVRGTVASKMAQIIDVLASDGRPLIIDEADYLVRKNTIDLVREMSDRSGAGVILIGEENLPRKLAAFERTYNRVLSWQYAQPCDRSAARALARLMAGGIEIEDALLDHLVKATRGVTRTICTNLDNIREFAELHDLELVSLGQWGVENFYSGRAPERTRSQGRAA